MAHAARITYLLGAGASYHALPIIDELNEGFRIIAEKCGAVMKPHSHMEHADFERARTKLQTLLSKFAVSGKEFNTIDTYAKKLAINEDREIVELKMALSLFFVIWQEMGNRTELAEKIGRTSKEDQKIIDPRYVTLLSNLLLSRDRKIELAENVNFITWNYDIQLERSIGRFIDNSSTDEILDTFDVYPYKSALWRKKPRIVHLNGIAGLYKTEAGNTKTLFDRGPVPRTHIEVIKDLLFFVNSSHHGQVFSNELFSYAWEGDEISKQAVSHAEEIMRKTDVLVIIGYSFPSFNQEVDRRLFSQLGEGKRGYKIYYQDPNADPVNLATRMKVRSDFIVPIKEVRQFHLPHEFMG